MKSTFLSPLEVWFENHTKSQLAEHPRIKIFTIDNPGWSLIVDLSGTELEKKKLEKISMDISEQTWLKCWIEDLEYRAACSPDKFLNILYVFFQFAKVWPGHDFVSNSDISWLQNWYISQCDGDWEHSNGIAIHTTSKPGWYFRVDLSETELEHKPLQNMKEFKDQNNWFIINKDLNIFEATSSPQHLSTVLSSFRKWASSAYT